MWKFWAGCWSVRGQKTLFYRKKPTVSKVICSREEFQRLTTFFLSSSLDCDVLLPISLTEHHELGSTHTHTRHVTDAWDTRIMENKGSVLSWCLTVQLARGNCSPVGPWRGRGWPWPPVIWGNGRCDDQNGLSDVYPSGSDIVHLDGNVMGSDWTAVA